MAVSVKVEQVRKTFGSFAALRGVSVEARPGELFFLLGPSGCGKTTLLRCIAGFHAPDSGTIHIGERDVTHVPPHKRDTGMVFQSYALWPHLTVAENVGFGLEMRKVPRPEIRRRALDALELVHMADRAKLRPNQLSGGQQQRVALARALVVEPQCLLLDEPLSNLDARLRLEMRSEIRRICKQAGITAVYVTHDQKEALATADRLAVMRDGMVEQVGTPEEVYRQPSNRFVAGFIGEGNFFSGRVVRAAAGLVEVSSPCGLFVARTPSAASFGAGEAVSLCLRPESVRVGRPAVGTPNVLSARFVESVYLGEVAQHMLEVAGAEGLRTLKIFELGPAAGCGRLGEAVSVWVEPERVIVTRS